MEQAADPLPRSGKVVRRRPRTPEGGGFWRTFRWLTLCWAVWYAWYAVVLADRAADGYVPGWWPLLFVAALAFVLLPPRWWARAWPLAVLVALPMPVWFADGVLEDLRHPGGQWRVHWGALFWLHAGLMLQVLLVARARRGLGAAADATRLVTSYSRHHAVAPSVARR